MTVALLLFEKVQPEPKPLSNFHLGLILLNTLFIGAGLFMNLAFEDLGIDLYAFGILSSISIYLLWLNRKDFRSYPITLYCAIGYGSGTLLSVLAKVL